MLGVITPSGKIDRFAGSEACAIGNARLPPAVFVHPSWVGIIESDMDLNGCVFDVFCLYIDTHCFLLRFVFSIDLRRLMQEQE